MLRPFARRRASTRRPPTEAMRARKPCSRFRARFLGWYVGFPMYRARPQCAQRFLAAIQGRKHTNGWRMPASRDGLVARFRFWRILGAVANLRQTLSAGARPQARRPRPCRYQDDPDRLPRPQGVVDGDERDRDRNRDGRGRHRGVGHPAPRQATHRRSLRGERPPWGGPRERLQARVERPLSAPGGGATLPRPPGQDANPTGSRRALRSTLLTPRPWPNGLGDVD